MIAIRPAGPEDAATVIALANALNRYEGKPDTPLTPARYCEDAFGAAPWFGCLIAEREGKAVGFAAYSRCFGLESGHRGLYLIDLFVITEARRQSVGHALMASLARTALDLGCAYIDWQVLRWNEEAQAFYRAIGGREEQVQSFSMGPAELQDLAKAGPEGL